MSEPIEINYIKVSKYWELTPEMKKEMKEFQAKIENPQTLEDGLLIVSLENMRSHLHKRLEQDMLQSLFGEPMPIGLVC